jgi:perosamine synthetase
MDRQSLIPVAGPWITEKEIESVTEAARTSWYGGAGQAVREFERSMAALTQRKFAIALPHCTSGLHLILRAANIGPHPSFAMSIPRRGA